ncbi:MAG: hypothetical protein ACRENX_09315 [Candidatus Dormibacteria bacterium]
MTHPPARGAPLFRIDDPRELGQFSYAVPPTVELTTVEGVKALRYGRSFEPDVHRSFSRGPIESTALVEFVGLAEAVSFPSAVLGFARRWGPLELCEAHLRPSAHRTKGLEGCPPWQDHSCQPDTRWAEPIESWRAFSSSLAALLEILADINEYGRCTRDDLWEKLAWGPRLTASESRAAARRPHPADPASEPLPASWREGSRTDYRPPRWPAGNRPVPAEIVELWPRGLLKDVVKADWALEVALANWLNLVPLPLLPLCRRDEARRFDGELLMWRVTVRSGSLAGRLITELAGTIAEGPRIYRCSTCRAPYVVDDHGRRPSTSPGRRHHCQRCREGGRYTVPKVIRQRERRAAARPSG